MIEFGNFIVFAVSDRNDGLNPRAKNQVQNLELECQIVDVSVVDMLS